MWHVWAFVGGGHLSTLVLTWIEIWKGKENERKSIWIELQNLQTKKIGQVQKKWKKMCGVISAEMTCICFRLQHSSVHTSFTCAIKVTFYYYSEYNTIV